MIKEDRFLLQWKREAICQQPFIMHEHFLKISHKGLILCVAQTKYTIADYEMIPFNLLQPHKSTSGCSALRTSTRSEFGATHFVLFRPQSASM